MPAKVGPGMPHKLLFHMESPHFVNSHQRLKLEVAHVMRPNAGWTFATTVAMALYFSNLFPSTAAYTPLSLEELRRAVSDCVETFPAHVNLMKIGPTAPEKSFIFNGKLLYTAVYK